MLDICLLGTGGMMPLPKRRLTALMARYNGKNILIDCGEGTQVGIKERGWSFKAIDVICFTHYHADHISGLPGLLLTMGNTERTEPLVMIGPKGLEKVVNCLRVIAPELPFEIKFKELSDKEHVITMDGYEIEAFKVNHRITCYCYNIVIKRQGKFQVEKANELGIPVKYWNRLQKGENVEVEGELYTSDMVIGQQRKGIKVTYCTDTRPDPIIEKAANNSDLFICEGMYGEDDKQSKAVEYKHMTFREAAKIARAAKPKEMWLTHFSPSLVRPEEYIESIKDIFLNSYPGKDLKTVTIDFEE